MEIFKYKKEWYIDLAQLLKDVGATSGNIGLPEHVYWSAEDEKKTKKAIRAAFLKRYGYMTKRSLDNGVGMEVLNYGPNSSLKNVIKPGYIVVDINAISREG